MASRALKRRPPLLVHPELIELDDRLYEAMINAVGETLAMGAVDAVWRVLAEVHRDDA